MDQLRSAVICEPLRTPVGRYGGAYKALSATDLATVVLRELVKRAGLQENSVDDVIFGQCYPSGESPAIGRVAALDAGLGIGTPGFQIDRRCGSSLQAVVTAAMQVQTGVSDLAIAGGAESMSNVEHYATIRWGTKGDGLQLHDRLARARVTAGGKDYPVPGGMLETAENLRREYSIPREEQDAFSVRSHERAIAAHEAGRFAAELVPVSVPQRKGDPVVVDRDEHPRPGTTLESLARLKPVLGRQDAEATVTAGNASGQNDGASACIVTTPERAEELGLRPIARLAGWAVAGVEPSRMGIGPVPSTAKVLDRLGLTIADLDVIELNEAFAAQALACTREWGFTESDFERLNPNGSGISLGHPVGATGTRIMATLLHELDRREARYGLETMCIGGGQGMSAVFERIA